MSGIIEWRKYIPNATSVCRDQFYLILEEKDFEELDHEDLFIRICNRYVNWAKLIHHKVKKYFDSLWGLHGIAPQFSKKDAKWLLGIIDRRLTDKKNPHLTIEDMEELLLLVAIIYNFWLAKNFV